jgi:hypothetical protein
MSNLFSAISASYTLKFKPNTDGRKYTITAEADTKVKTLSESTKIIFSVEKKFAGWSMTVPRGIIYKTSVSFPYSFTSGSALRIDAQLNNTSCLQRGSFGGTVSVTPTVYTVPGLYQLVFKISNLISEYIERRYQIYIDAGFIKSTIVPKLTNVKRLHPFVVTTTVRDGNKIKMTATKQGDLKMTLSIRSATSIKSLERTK